MTVQHQFVQVGERRVLVRHAGRGPAVMLLHQSPESSASLLPWFDRLADRFAVFAPDTPGFGQSDPLPLAQPTIPDLAAALGALLDALRIERVLLYGVHTGASIAARLARDRPDRVAALVCDGLSAFSTDERQPLLDGYLPPFEPGWDGGHLLWLWARVREQTLFFPWHVPSAAARLERPLATPEQIQHTVLELLDAGDGYRAGYRAPLLYEHGAALAPQLRGPAWLLYRRADVLRPHLDRLPALPATVQAAEVADVPALVGATTAAFDAQAAGASMVDAGERVAAATSPRHRVLHGPAGALAFRCRGERGSAAELLLPDIGTPAQVPPDAAIDGFALALELPGHGASSGWYRGSAAPQAVAEAIETALHTLGIRTLALCAVGGSCRLALALAMRLGSRCQALTLHDPLPLSADEAQTFLARLPDLAPVASGAHLIDAWNWARLKSLFRPWQAPDAAAALRAPAPPPRRVHDEVVEMLRARAVWQESWRHALALDPADWRAALAALGTNMAVTVDISPLSAADPERERLAARLGQRLTIRAAAPSGR